MVTIRAMGEWSERQVVVETVASTHRVPAAVQRQIDEAWARASAQPGVKLFDGPMARWEGWEATPQRLLLRLSRTSYKAFLGTNMATPPLERALLANPVGLSVALESADGRLVLGRRNASVAYYPERIHPFAGALEPREAERVFDGVRRELREELAISEEELSSLACIGLVEDATLRQGELVFQARSTLTEAQLRRRVDETEHRGLVAVTPEAAEGMLAEAGHLTPVCVATILLWMRPQRGQAWFEQARRRFEPAKK